jgi:hypothetical protein
MGRPPPSTPCLMMQQGDSGRWSELRFCPARVAGSPRHWCFLTWALASRWPMTRMPNMLSAARTGPPAPGPNNGVVFCRILFDCELGGTGHR